MFQTRVALSDTSQRCPNAVSLSARRWRLSGAAATKTCI